MRQPWTFESSLSDEPVGLGSFGNITTAYLTADLRTRATEKS